MLLPFPADQEELGRNNIQQFVQIILGNPASIVCHDTLPGTGQPNLRCVWRRLAPDDMNVDRLPIFIGPKEHQVTAYAEQVRHNGSLPAPRNGKASGHYGAETHQKAPAHRGESPH